MTVPPKALLANSVLKHDEHFEIHKLADARNTKSALPGRLELPTLRLTASRSSQLSYGSTREKKHLTYVHHTVEG